MSTIQLITYRDPVEGFSGYLAYAGLDRPLAAGGLRVAPGLRAEMIAQLASAMSFKEQILGLNVDGAKCGIDYDPRSPGKHAAMRRFLRFLKPHLDGRLSLGPDMGTSFGEIEAIARREGILSVKAAIGRAQGLSSDEVLARLRLLEEPVGSMRLGERRAGHALAHASVAVMRSAGATSGTSSYVLQGFGTLGRAAALTLHELGVKLVAVADEFSSLRRDQGLDVLSLLAMPHGALLSEYAGSAERGPRGEIFEVPADVAVLAACEDAMTEAEAAALMSRTVAVGANWGLSTPAARVLHKRGIFAVPDFVGGAGGSAAMDALFAPALCPSPVFVLDAVGRTVSQLVEQISRACVRSGMTPRQAALRVAAARRPAVAAKPYGLRVLVGTAAGDARSPEVVETWTPAQRLGAGT